MATGVEDISLITAANNITAAANAWLNTFLWGAVLLGMALVIAGFVYSNARNRDPRQSLTPIFSLLVGGSALVWASLWFMTLEVTFFETDAVYVYDSGGHHDWEARLFIATQSVTRLIGVGAYFWGLGTLALVGLNQGRLGDGRMTRGLLRTLFGFLLACIGLVITIILHTFGLPSPFQPQ